MELAERMGVSFQQIQKYEKGTTKIYVSRLRELADALNVSLATFTRVIEESSYVGEAGTDYSAEKTGTSEGLSLNKEEKVLLKHFRKVKNEKLRKGIIKIIQGISELEEV